MSLRGAAQLSVRMVVQALLSAAPVTKLQPCNADQVSQLIPYGTQGQRKSAMSLGGNCRRTGQWHVSQRNICTHATSHRHPLVITEGSARWVRLR